MNKSSPASLPLTPEALTEIRDELRTPFHLILGYCATLLADTGVATHAVRKTAVEAAQHAARDVLALIDRALPPSRRDALPSDVAVLSESLREPQRRLMKALSALLAPGEPVLETALATEARRLSEAETEMLAVGSIPGRSSDEVSRPALPQRSRTTEGQAARILLVDDTKDVRVPLQRSLERDGYAVDVAENGRIALEKIAEEAFDLVLLDIEMPEVNGYEVLEQLKDSPATRDIPVLMISALDDLTSVVKCIERGAEDHLAKPFEPVLLRARIRASLEKKRLRNVELEYLQEVNQVIEAASAVEGRRYESKSLAVVAQRADALGRLARVFDGMAGHVEAREQRLSRQVEALTMEIEEARRQSRPSQAAPEPPELHTGEVFAGRYEIIAEVGAGGMGMVYKAHDRELDEDVAIKTLRSDLLDGHENIVERFKLEIRLARRISHRNVVRTHDFGQCDGVYYLTMEYVEGMTVRELIDTRGQLGVASTLAIAQQLAQSLAVAHDVGVIHRDVKPQNLLLDETGVLKVMDFGVACLAGRTGSLTRPGTVVGTPAYMAPEQLLGGEVDPRSDLYAAGVVLYECLTGKVPFEIGTSESLIVKLLEERPVSPSDINGDVPPAVSALVLRLLALRPDDRMSTAAELAEQLAQLA